MPGNNRLPYLNALREAGIFSPERELRLLQEHAGATEGELAKLVYERCAGKPMAHILGYRSFWKHDFEVTPNVLIPRADSEVMIELILQYLPDHQQALDVLDLGTGSGCLLLSVLHEYPQAYGVGIDRSPDALAVAQRNANRCLLTARCVFQPGDWAKGLTGQYDLVISNPPYIPLADMEALMQEVKGYEPHEALQGGEDGLDCYRDILAQIPEFMKSDALLIFEVGIHQAQQVSELAQAAGLELREIRKDYNQIERMIVLQKR